MKTNKAANTKFTCCIKKTRCSIEILKYDKTNQSDITKSTLFYSNT